MPTAATQYTDEKKEEKWTQKEHTQA